MMMNRVLWDFINTGKVVSFMNDVIMRIEGEEEYDEIVEEVVKRLVENDLYMKPEKCKQKVREVGFLEVIIRIEDIKIEEEKVKGLLDWPTSKGIKDIQKFLKLANYYWQLIKDFMSISKPLYDLVKKDQK